MARAAETLWSYGGWVRGVGVPVIAVAFVACSTADTGGTPQATDVAPSVSPVPASTTFASKRHAYSVRVPPDWDVTEYEGVWRRLNQFHPGAEVPGEDVISSPDGTAFLVANSMAIPKKMTVADWLSTFDGLVAAGLDRNCPSRRDTGVTTGEPATIVEQQCEGMIIIGRSLTRGGRGYYFTTGFSTGDAAAEATLDRIVDSIRFVEG